MLLVYTQGPQEAAQLLILSRNPLGKRGVRREGQDSKGIREAVAAEGNLLRSAQATPGRALDC